MKSLACKRVLLGISGGIAAYKSAELVRRLREQDAEVRVVMTRSACEFITPLTMQALSGRPVHTALLDHHAEAGMGHIELARWSDVVLIAPASANFIARLAQGMADDLLTTLCLVTAAPIFLAPAMNQQMWQSSATQHNILLLEKRGIGLAGPAVGEQACGEVGPGRMLEPLALVELVVRQFSTNLLSGTNVLITAGPTREAIDPIRYITNRSTGRMGYAMACAAREAGANVSLVSGPVALDIPERIKHISVDTAEQMLTMVLNETAAADIFIAAAAVADYRCRRIAEHKIKKDEAQLSLTLERNPDILATVSALANPPFTVGFAAETERLAEHAREKLQAKRLDMIAANQVGSGKGFESEENALEVFWRDGHQSLGLAHKNKLARALIRIVAERYYEKNSARMH